MLLQYKIMFLTLIYLEFSAAMLKWHMILQKHIYFGAQKICIIIIDVEN